MTGGRVSAVLVQRLDEHGVPVGEPFDVLPPKPPKLGRMPDRSVIDCDTTGLFPDPTP